MMSRRQRKKARKADKKKQKQEEKAAVAEAKARAKRERQEAKLAKKNKKAHMMDESEHEPKRYRQSRLTRQRQPVSTQEIVLPQEPDARRTGAREVHRKSYYQRKKHQPKNRNRQTKRKIRTNHCLQETASLFAADIASMMGENQTEETEEPEADRSRLKNSKNRRKWIRHSR